MKLSDIQARSAIARAVGKFVTEYIGNEYETAGNDDLAARVGSILDEQKRILGQLSQE